MGEGMPWNIIMIFFVLGALLGANAGKNELIRRDAIPKKDGEQPYD
ncbi:MAG: hypothetical protein NW218_16560 [Saprospiraceae bacterium]|jgi:hypothetical protein|nr:hypothetical protein [Saprospiraceae bacterium]